MIFNSLVCTIIFHVIINVNLTFSYITLRSKPVYNFFEGIDNINEHYDYFNIPKNTISSSLTLSIKTSCPKLFLRFFIRYGAIPFYTEPNTYSVPFLIEDENQVEYNISRNSTNQTISIGDTILNFTLIQQDKAFDLTINLKYPLFGDWYYLITTKRDNFIKFCNSLITTTIQHDSFKDSKYHLGNVDLTKNGIFRKIKDKPIVTDSSGKLDDAFYVVYNMPIFKNSRDSYIIKISLEIGSCKCGSDVDLCSISFGFSKSLKFPTPFTYMVNCSQQFTKRNYEINSFVTVNEENLLLSFSYDELLQNANFSLDITRINVCELDTTSLQSGGKNFKKANPKRLTLINNIDSTLGSLVEQYVERSFLSTDELFNRQPCSFLPHPSKIVLATPYTFDFFYKPKMSNYANSLRLQPWRNYILPLSLTGNKETGGTLEISLQLNSLDETFSFNATHVSSLLRQEILYGCFSQNVILPTSKECTHWFRLATINGVYSSVKKAFRVALEENNKILREKLDEIENVDFNSTLDRSFLFFPYPRAGDWYLSLYSECYSIDRFCDNRFTIKVGLVIRSSPCIRFRCGDIGIGATLYPSRLMNPNTPKYRRLKNDSNVDVNPRKTNEDGKKYQNLSNDQHYHPIWWWNDQIKNHKDNYPADYFDKSPLSKSFHSWSHAREEGICVNYAVGGNAKISKCLCNSKRYGLGCLKNPNSSLAIISPNKQQAMSVSQDAVILAISNLSFLPAACLAIKRRLWGPALAYIYTFIFSIMHHICDTESGQQMGKSMYTFSPGSTQIGQDDIIYNPNSLFSIYHSFFSSKSFVYCPLPRDTLSFCDFFGGIFSIAITLITTAALPTPLTECFILISVFGLIIGLNIARYHLATFLIPLIIGLILNVISWIIWSIRLKRLFPPVQWFILGLFPGIIISSIGLVLFVHPDMKKKYTVMHSIWHIMIGLSLIFILPHAKRWRRALIPVCSIHNYISCGGHVKLPSRFDEEEFSSTTFKSPWYSFKSRRRRKDGDLDNSDDDRGDVSSTPKIRRLLCGISTCFSRISDYYEDFMELNPIIDPIIVRMPRFAKFIVPYGYKSKLESHRYTNGDSNSNSDNTPETEETILKMDPYLFQLD